LQEKYFKTSNDQRDPVSDDTKLKLQKEENLAKERSNKPYERQICTKVFSFTSTYSKQMRFQTE
jgi:hypothetical protein